MENSQQNTVGQVATNAANAALNSMEINGPIKVTVGNKKYNVEVTPNENTSTGGRRRRNKRKGTRRNKRKGTRRNKRKGTRRNKRN